MVEALSGVLDELAAVDLTGLAAAALGERIIELLTARNRLDGVIEAAIGVFDAQGLCQADACPSTASWLRARGRLAPVEASARVKTARALRELPMVSAALVGGSISFDHARAVALLAHQTDIADTRAVQRQILDVARLTDPARFAGELRAVRDSLREGTDKPPADEHDMFARRELSITPVLDGFNLRGWLPDEAGALIKSPRRARRACPRRAAQSRPAQRRCARSATERASARARPSALPATRRSPVSCSTPTVTCSTSAAPPAS